MKIEELSAAVEVERAKLPAVNKKAARRKAIEDTHKGHAKVGGRIAGKPKKDRTAQLAARQAARQARQARKAELLP